MLLAAVMFATGLAAGGTQPSARDQLLAVDRDAGSAAGRHGLAGALGSRLAEDAVLLYGGAPVVTGSTAIGALLRAQPMLDSLTVSWTPEDGWVSSDGLLGVTQGYLSLQAAAEPGASRRGTYIAGWRRERGGWRLVGLMLAGVAPADRTRIPAGLGPTERPALAPTGPAQAMIQADLDFAALAGRAGAGEAFRTYAAPDAVVLGGGEPRRGPEAIGAAIAAGPPADWGWYPVVAMVAPTGDLGFTVGQAVIRPKSGGAPTLSKYLTVWRRQSDGSMKFLTDGGNQRPSP